MLKNNEGDRSVVDQVLDFSKALFDTGVEKPVNAVIQIGEWATGKHLPKLDIVETPTSFGGKMGSFVAQAAEVYLLSRAVGGGLSKLGVPHVGIVPTALRLGTTGAIYGGILEPSPEGKNFLESRVKSAAISAGTWAALGVASEALASPALMRASGLVRPAPFRSLLGSIGIGATSGAVGGLAHAELSAMINKGRMATLDEAMTDVVSYGVMGAAFGALGNIQMRMQQRAAAKAFTSPADQFRSNGRDVSVVRGRDGQIVGISITSGEYSPGQHGWSLDSYYYTPGTDGGWITNHRFPIGRNAGKVSDLSGVGQLADGTIVAVQQPIKVNHGAGNTPSYLHKIQMDSPANGNLWATIVNSSPTVSGSLEGMVMPINHGPYESFARFRTSASFGAPLPVADILRKAAEVVPQTASTPVKVR